MKPAYYWSGGIFLKVLQKRQRDPDKVADVWCNPEQGKWTIAFDGHRVKKFGFIVRGKRTQHVMFERWIKAEGERKNAARQKCGVQLKRATANVDKIDPGRVEALLRAARALKGSLLLMDANSAEVSYRSWQVRMIKSAEIQRTFRGFKAKKHKKLLLARIALKKKLRKQLELHCAGLARAVVPTFLKEGLRLARKKLKKPEFSCVRELDGEKCILTLQSASHYDYFSYRTNGIPCVACQCRRARKSYSMAHQEERTYNGPCTCVLVRPAERILVQAYNPLNQRLYTTIVNEQTMREQLTRQQRRSGGDPDTYVMRATRYERLPSDYCLIMNVGPFRRERFEPVRERHFAIKRSRAADKLAQHKAERHGEAKRKLAEARAVMGQMEYAAKVAQRKFEREHKALLYGQVHLQAMIKAAEDALYFSRHQLAMYADLSKSSLQNSWDPLENANDHVWLKRKYEARKKLVLQVAIRDVAYRASFRADLAVTAARIALDAAIKEEAKADAEAR